MSDLSNLIENCKKFCLELAIVNKETFNDKEYDFDFSIWYQDNLPVEVKFYYQGCWDTSIFSFSYSAEPCVYMNTHEIATRDFVLGGNTMGYMQKIFDELIKLNKEFEQ